MKTSRDGGGRAALVVAIAALSTLASGCDGDSHDPRSQVELELIEVDVDPQGVAVLPAGFQALGSYRQGVPGVRLAAKELRRGALAHPTDYRSACALDDVWRPIPPPGYVALGLVEAQAKPALNEVVCVRRDLTTTGYLGDPMRPGAEGRWILPADAGGVHVGTFEKSWDLLAPPGPFTDNTGWGARRYYSTIQTGDLDGDGRSELLARHSTGIRVYGLDPTTGAWALLGSAGPCADNGGWGAERYYSTIQTADVDGDGRDELLARHSTGMQVYGFDTVRGSWDLLGDKGPCTDGTGWGAEKYYATIQTGDVDGDGLDELLARHSTGMQVYRFDGGQAAWSLIGQAGPCTNGTGWGAEKYYATIQTGDVDGDGRAELLARAGTGMEVYRFDATSGAWTTLGVGGPVPDETFSLTSWGAEPYCDTIQTCDVDADGRAELLARLPSGMQVHRFDPTTGAWTMLAGHGPFADRSGWFEPRYYRTIQACDVNGDGAADLLARSAAGVVVYSFDQVRGAWEGECFGPSCSDGSGWGAERYYGTLQTGDLDGDGRADLLARHSTGMLAYRFTAAGPSWSGPELTLPVLDASRVRVPAPLDRQEVQRLIGHYGPIMVFHDQERYFPEDPVWALDNDTILAWALVDTPTSESFVITARAEVPTSAGTLMNDVSWLETQVRPYPPYDDSPSFQYWLEHATTLEGDVDRARAVIRVVPWNHFWTEIQFWIYYPFNGPGRCRLCVASGDCVHMQFAQVGRHYGDWEHVTLRIRNRTMELDAVFLSAHAGGYWFDRSDFRDALEFRGGSHPVVYSAKYSHANYSAHGRHYYERIFGIDWGAGTASGDLYDDTSEGESIYWYLPGEYGLVSFADDPVPPAAWLSFDGRWGKRETQRHFFTILGAPVYTYKTVGIGPTGPSMKVAWRMGESAYELGYPISH